MADSGVVGLPLQPKKPRKEKAPKAAADGEGGEGGEGEGELAHRPVLGMACPDSKN